MQSLKYLPCPQQELCSNSSHLKSQGCARANRYESLTFCDTLCLKNILEKKKLHIICLKLVWQAVTWTSVGLASIWAALSKTLQNNHLYLADLEAGGLSSKLVCCDWDS